MRMMMKVTLPNDGGNRAIKDGSMPKIVGDTLAKLKPEAAYFGLEGGQRTAWVVFDLGDASEMPSVGEPLFLGVNAKIELSPVMNREDLEKGLSSVLRTL